MYRERVAYHESVEEELKRNLESQVDVVLKMEEERLMLLKEGKEVKERENRVRDENKRMRERIEQVETELEGLQVQIKEQMSMMQQSDSVTTEDEKENKNVVNRVKAAPSKNASTIKKPVKKATSTLKFQAAMSKAGPLADTSAISTTQHQVLGAAHIDDSISNPSISKSLVSDNQLLTAELITLNREVTRLKSDMRVKEDQFKKSEKERLEAKKIIEGKEVAVEKLRKERDELWAVVNTDKYKNLRTIE